MSVQQERTFQEMSTHHWKRVAPSVRVSLPEVCKQSYTNHVASKVPHNFKIQPSFQKVLPCCLPSFLINEKDGKITGMSSPELRRATDRGKGQEMGVTPEPGGDR